MGFVCGVFVLDPIYICNAPEAFSEPAVALASGCDSPEAMEESPVPSASPPTSCLISCAGKKIFVALVC